MFDLTLTLTACDRLDLLEKTLKSFASFNSFPISELLIRDDSGLFEIYKDTHNLLVSLDLPFRWRLLDLGQLGQAASIDRMLNEVKTSYVFHLEDDWEFYRSGFIEDCLAVIDDNTVQVWVRDRNDGVTAKTGKEVERNEVKANIVETHNFSFNPHLRKMSNLRFEGKNETLISEWVKSQKLETLWLQDGACRHIGGEKTTNRSGTPYQAGVKKA